MLDEMSLETRNLEKQKRNMEKRQLINYNVYITVYIIHIWIIHDMKGVGNSMCHQNLCAETGTFRKHNQQTQFNLELIKLDGILKKSCTPKHTF